LNSFVLLLNYSSIVVVLLHLHPILIVLLGLQTSADPTLPTPRQATSSSQQRFNAKAVLYPFNALVKPPSISPTQKPPPVGGTPKKKNNNIK